MFLTETEADTAVVAAIQYTGYRDTATIALPDCFEVTDALDAWTLCAEDQATADSWVCEIKKELG